MTELEYFGIRKGESLSDVREYISRNRVCSFVGGEKVSSLRDFECSFEYGRLYEFQFIQRKDGFAYFAAFVVPKGIDKFLVENEKYASEIGFDPLSYGGLEVITEVFVYSPSSFPSKEIETLRAKAEDAKIVLVTTNKIIKSNTK